MITESILDVFYSFLEWLFSLIPEVTLPDGLLKTLYPVLRYINAVNQWFPMDTLFTLVPIVLGWWLLCAVISAVLQLL